MRTRALSAILFLIAAGLGALALAAQPAANPQPHKSVRGTLQSVDERLRGAVMTTEDGQRLAWRLSAAVIAAVAKVAPGSPMIVIYRQIASNEKRVTAVAFPGTASTAVYVNLTGARVSLRSGAAVDGVCTGSGGPVKESVILPEGRAELQDACWCCAPAGHACAPTTKSGQGQAFLERCFD